ncbi:hypothetical protein KsCSTR_01680 [Candidatus Kuenenia stuttgartiensis]|uniref:Uncharacterized protein n=1 Tax=Kuenenia stuttgartiensis TaxID=174633 RepID=Q1PUY0_KUEST|nr:hypothetical protein KsCSTR_01680 [Candidatus Kuenenia stuttgartiensis]CAJ71034.1 unknown protein [Candidatus Kuenenia stuttgartiensis]
MWVKISFIKGDFSGRLLNLMTLGYKPEPANVVSRAITFPNRHFTMFSTRFENELCFGSLIDYAE